MPSDLTVDEVRELQSRADELLAVFSHEGRHAYRPLDCDEMKIVTFLCRRFLASQQPMTAGEFAGLVVEEITTKSEKYDEQAARCDEDDGWLIGFSAGFDEVEMIIRNLTAEHNIEIVKPPKP